MARRSQYSFVKRQKELKRKKKAQLKRERRLKKKEEENNTQAQGTEIPVDENQPGPSVSENPEGAPEEDLNPLSPK